MGGVQRRERVARMYEEKRWKEGWKGMVASQSSAAVTFRMALAASSSPTISSRPAKPSSDSFDLSWMKDAHLAKRKLSLTISFSSGKCHEYHSRTRMANVLMSCR